MFRRQLTFRNPLARNGLLPYDGPDDSQILAILDGIDLDQVRQPATGVGFGHSGTTVAGPTGRTISTKRLSV